MTGVLAAELEDLTGDEAGVEADEDLTGVLAAELE